LQPSESKDKNIIKNSNLKPLLKGFDVCNSKFTLNGKNSLQVLGEKQGGVGIFKKNSNTRWVQLVNS
jgi:hypothetical protein